MMRNTMMPQPDLDSPFEREKEGYERRLHGLVDDYFCRWILESYFLLTFELTR